MKVNYITARGIYEEKRFMGIYIYSLPFTFSHGGVKPRYHSSLAISCKKTSDIVPFSSKAKITTRTDILAFNIVACQGGGVSSKTRRRGADKTRSLNPLVC